MFPSAHLRETREYARVLRGLFVAGALAQVTALVLLVRAAPRLEARARGGGVLRALQLLLVALALAWLVRLPFAAAAHAWRRRHGLSRQGYADWILTPWLELLAAVGVACVALAAAILLARRLGRRWWLAGGALLAVIGSGVILLQPLVLAPRLDPLEDRRLAREIGALARELGLEEPRVQVERASERTTTANAAVAGLGPTRRVILWDTLLDGRFSRGEIRFVAAHELAHVARRHLWKGLAWVALLALPGVFVLAEVTRRRGGIAEPAAAPLAVLTVVALQLALLPLSNVLSRRYEAEADWVALEATRDPVAAETLLRRFSETSLVQPAPPQWAYALLATHPSLVERTELARAWATRRAAEPPAGS